MADPEPRGTWLPVRWQPDPAATGPRRARTPALIEAFVPEPVDAGELSLSAAATTAAADAERAIARLQRTHAAGLLRTLSAQMLRSEAIASSQMEGVVVPSNRTLAKVGAGGRHHPNAQAALEAIAAVTDAYAWAAAGGAFTTEILLDLHRAVARGDRALAPHAGAWREGQNWIGRDPYTPVGADFVPPPRDHLEPLIDDLVALLERRDLSPVVQAAVAHAQFETLHPFADGNGRVGRILVGMLLRRDRLVEEIDPPVSLVLARDRERYVAALTAWRLDRRDGPSLLVSTIAEALEEAASATARLVDDVDRLLDTWRSTLDGVRAHSAAWALLELLPSRPIVSATSAAEALGRSPQRVRDGLALLQERGVVRPVTLGRRNVQYEAVGVFALLDAFERELSGGRLQIAETR
jgi:Fic family protein